MTTTFNFRTFIAIQGPRGQRWLRAEDISSNIPSKAKQWIVTSNKTNATAFVITQRVLDDGTTTHTFRCGKDYIGLEKISGCERLVLVDQAFPWFLTAVSTATPTTSTIDLLNLAPFFIMTKGGQTVDIRTQDSVVTLNTTLGAVKNTTSLDVLEQSQPTVSPRRTEAGAGPFSPAESGAPMYTYTSGGAVTINGFEAGVDGQRLSLYVTGGGTVTLVNESTLVVTNERITTPSGANETTPANGSFELVYDGTTSRWIMLTQLSGAGGSVVSLADGSAAAPSLSFAADSNTGIYRLGADVDVLRFTNGGADSLRMTTTGMLPTGDAVFNIGSLTERMATVFTSIVSAVAGNNLTLTGDAVIPDADNTRDLGLVGTRWATAFATGVNSGASNLTLTPTAAVVPDADISKTLGLVGTRWTTVFTTGVNSGASDLTLTPTLAVVPDADNTKNLGENATRWNTLHATTIDATDGGGSGSLTLNVFSSVNPDTDNARDLGSTSFKWRSLYLGTSILNPAATNVTVDLGGAALVSGSATELGATGAVWPKVWTTDIDSDGATMTLTSGVADIVASSTGAVRPDVTNTIDLGVDTLRWKDFYVAGGIFLSGKSTDPLAASGVDATPVLTGSSGAPSSITYTSRYLKWFRTGDTVHVQGAIIYTALSADATGTLQVTTSATMPPVDTSFVPAVADGTFTFASNAVTLTDGPALARITSTTAIQFYENTAAGAETAINAATGGGVPNVNAGGTIRFSITYQTVTA